jgi:CRISPR-associated protein Cas2
MWSLVMFDLPVKTPTERKSYQRFRQALLNKGFVAMQYSIYMRFCHDAESLETHVKFVRSILPPKGEVRVMGVTDKQFKRCQVFVGCQPLPAETAPKQLEFF